MAVYFKVLSNLGKVSVRFQSCQSLVGWVSVHFSQTGKKEALVLVQFQYCQIKAWGVSPIGLLIPKWGVSI